MTHHSPALRLFLLLPLLALPGCQSDRTLAEEWSRRAEQHLAQQLEAAPASGSNSTADLSPTPAAIDAVTAQTLGDVEACVSLAMSRHPLIRSGAFRVQRLLAREPQARSLDDPMLESMALGEMAQTAAGEMMYTVGVSQKLPFPGKLGLRAQAARQEAQQAQAQLEVTRRQIALQTRSAWWRHYLIGQQESITRQSRQVLASFEQIAQTRVRAGQGAQTQLLRLGVELGNLDARLIDLAQQRQSAAAELNELLSRPTDAPVPVPAQIDASTALTQQQLPEQLDKLLTEAATQHPRLAAARAMVAQYRTQLRLARLERFPDLTTGVSYAAVDDMGISPVANGKDQWWVTLGINIPLWQPKLAAAEHEALAGVGEGLTELQAAHNQIARAVRDAVARVLAQAQLVDLFEQRIVPQARQTLDLSITAYTAGSADFVLLLDNWRQLLDLELMQQGNVTQLQIARAQLLEALGRPPELVPPEAAAPGSSAALLAPTLTQEPSHD